MKLTISAGTEDEDGISNEGGERRSSQRSRMQLNLSESSSSPANSNSNSNSSSFNHSRHHSRNLSLDSDFGDSSTPMVFDNKRAKIAFFARDCTAITDYLFVGGKKVASSEDTLKAKGITHIINCLPGDTLVNMANHTTRRIDTVQVGDQVLSYDRQHDALIPRPVRAVLDRGMKECIELTLLNGVTLTCTPDHRLLDSSRKWRHASSFPPGSHVSFGLISPFDRLDEDTVNCDTWSLDLTNSLGVVLDMKANRSRSIAFVRTLGYVLTDGSLDARGDESYLYLGHQLDVEAIRRDLALILPGQVFKVTPPSFPHDNFIVELGVAMTRAFLQIGVQPGTRGHIERRFPSFLTEPQCPLPLVRSFLSGFFGGDGNSLVLRPQSDRLSGLGWSMECKESVAAAQFTVFQAEFTSLLHRCGISDDTLVWDNTSLNITLKFRQQGVVDFSDRIGFAYSCHKQERLDAGVAVLRAQLFLLSQRQAVASQLNHPSSSRVVTFPERFALSKAIVDEATPLHPSVMKDWRPLTMKQMEEGTTLEGFSNEGFGGMGARVLLTAFNAIGLFCEEHNGNMSDSNKSENVKYCVDRNAVGLPILRMEVVRVREIGFRKVFDLTVPSGQDELEEGEDDDASFMANGTVVHNCAGDVCENYFPEQFHYLKLHLLDSSQEDLMTVLYKVIDFIDVVRQGKNKVLVHCQQGVSRSTVLVIAYLMYLENRDYDAIYEYVRARRGICRPNVGFMCQLLAWRKRVTRLSNRPYCLYRIGPHNSRDRSLVTKWIDRVEVDSLDSRTLFLLQTNGAGSANFSSDDSSSHAPHVPDTPSGSSVIYIWVGMLCPRESERTYIPYIAHLIAKIQQVEHAGKQVLLIRQRGREKLEKAEALARGHFSPKGALQSNLPTSPNPAHSGSMSPAYPSSHQTHHYSPLQSSSLASPSPSSSASPSRVGSAGATHSTPSSSSASSSAIAFSSEHISASFHTLESAPQILSASSLSSLYPAATPRQISHFYRIFGLEDTEDYSHVGMDRSHPISSAILANVQLDEEYPDVRIPDVDALNEIALKHSRVTSANGSMGRPSTPQHISVGGTVPGGMVLPPVVRVGFKSPSSSTVTDNEEEDDEQPQVSQSRGNSGDGDEEMTDAYARNLSANTSSSLTLQIPGRGGGDDSESNSPAFALPKKLTLLIHRNDDSPTPSSSRSSGNTGRISVNSGTPPVSGRKPKLLNLRGIMNGGDDDTDATMGVDAAAGEIGTIPIMRTPQHASLAATPQHVSAAATPKAPGGGSGQSSHRPLYTPNNAAAAASAQAASSAAAAVSAVPFSSDAPYLLYQFPDFAAGPIFPISLQSMQLPNIYVLYRPSDGSLWVHLPPPGQLFIPSKYEGDRDEFAGDIARSFQIAIRAEVNSVNTEVAGKESQEFLQAIAS